MKKIRVTAVFGTRPEATKMLPLVKALNESDMFETIVCVTAQHREMLDSVLDIFGITPDFDLDIMRRGQSLTDITVRALTGIEGMLNDVKPDLVLVHGDTSTTFAGSLAAFYQKIKVGHVEAGLRTYDKYQPFPEEINRRMTDTLADLHFAPTMLAKEYLLAENVREDSVFVTGNTAIDCLKNSVREDYVFNVPALNDIDYANKKVIAMTAHRRENIGEPFVNIFKAIRKIAADNPEVLIVYPVHPSPAVREQAFGILDGVPGIRLIEPLDMRDLHNLMNKAYMVVTDSGGIQEEATGLKKPVIVLRNVTERPEGLTAGALRLGGIEFESVYREITRVLRDGEVYRGMAQAANPFGDGLASERIRDALLYYYGIKDRRPADWNEI